MSRAARWGALFSPVLLPVIVRLFPRLARLYRRHVFLPLAGLLSRCAGLVPFPLAGLVSLALLCAFALRAKNALKNAAGRRRLLDMTGALAALFALLWTPLYACPALPAVDLSTGELADLCLELIEDANALLPAYEASDRSNLMEEAARFMSAETGLALSPAKFTRFPRLFNALGIAGLYFPLTAEALVNPDDLDGTLPFTVCHELAHRAGYAREDEANYIAYRASRDASPLFRFSADFSMLLYGMELLHGADRPLWEHCLDRMSEELYALFVRANGLMTAQVSATRRKQQEISDVFLKIGGQSAGVASYHRALFLIAAESQLSAGTSENVLPG